MWLSSLTVVTASYLLGGAFNPLTLLASLVGVTSLIFVARGDVLGQLLTVLFSILYAVISWQFRYYGEMMSYLGMTLPIAVLAVISWLRNPYSERQVRVGRMTAGKTLILLVLAGLVTWGFYYILSFFGTSNLTVSTISITTSFLAAALTVLRSPSYAIAYAANDIVLIVLWILAAIEDISFLPVVFCFATFLVNDIYAFTSWRRMQRDQQE